MNNGMARDGYAGPLDLSAGLCSETLLSVTIVREVYGLFASRAGWMHIYPSDHWSQIEVTLYQTIRLLFCWPAAGLACRHSIAFFPSPSGSDHLRIKPSRKYHDGKHTIVHFISISPAGADAETGTATKGDMTQPGPCSGSVQRKPSVSQLWV